MKMKRGIITQFNTEKIKAVIERVTIRAFADTAGGDGGDSNDNTGGEGGEKQTPTLNYEDLIAKARREEKEKQYKTIERLKQQVTTLTQQHNDDLIAVAEVKEQLQAANDKLTSASKGDSEEVNTLKQTVKDLEKAKSDLEAKIKEYEDNKPQSREEIEKEVRAELEAEYEVKTYKAEKMAELKDQLLVPELVSGDTKEDIDKSIEAALERSKQIRASLGLSDDGGKKKQTTTNKRTPKSPANPSSGGTEGKEISMDYLASLDVRSPEYAEVRKQLGLR